MALYDRNSIHYSDIDKEEIVYVSHPCEDDGQYDYLLLKNINKVSLQQINVKTLNVNTCKAEDKSVRFECSFNKEIDQINVKVCAMINGFNGSSVDIEIQTFVDEIAECIYNNELLESSERIISIKRHALEQLQKDYFIQTGNIMSNVSYDIVGKVVDVNGNTMAIINNFNTRIENEKMILTLNNCVSYIPLKDINVSKIEFITGKSKLIINDFKIISSIEGMLRQYQIIVDNAHVKESDEAIIAETVTDIYDSDFYFDSKVELLSNKESLFESSGSTNSVSDLFDDFDF